MQSCPGELPGMQTARNPKHKVKYFENHFFPLLILTTPGNCCSMKPCPMPPAPFYPGCRALCGEDGWGRVQQQRKLDLQSWKGKHENQPAERAVRAWWRKGDFPNPHWGMQLNIKPNNPASNLQLVTVVERRDARHHYSNFQGSLLLSKTGLRKSSVLSQQVISANN